jgi:hypothetical protein
LLRPDDMVAAKAVDQGVAYVLMLLALFVTYIVH